MAFTLHCQINGETERTAFKVKCCEEKITARIMNILKSMDWVRLVRAHACTLALALSLNTWWRVPRDAMRHGGLPYALAHTAVMLAVALPATLLQLAVGQLCQQDAIGMWKAVPFFKGVGYLRLLISLLESVYTVIYLAITITYFIYILSTLVPPECLQPIQMEQFDTSMYNTSVCKNVTLTAPVTDETETYLAVAFIIVALWVAFPFILYNPVKRMKLIFYFLGPVILLTIVVIVSCIGDKTYLLSFYKRSEWRNLLHSEIWHAALTQALWSSQIPNGFIITVSNTVYSNIDVEWTALAFIATNIAFSWIGSIFWFSVADGSNIDTSALAVLSQMFKVFEQKSLHVAWPLLTYAVLFLSGVISLVTLLIPLYVFFRNIGGLRWRIISFFTSLVCSAISLIILVKRIPVLDLLEDFCGPLLVSLATILEMSAFVLIYGWKLLSEDVAFLTGRALSKIWVVGWCFAPGIASALTAWWLVIAAKNSSWTSPYEATALTITTGVASLVIFVSASFVVAKQVQYDLFGKLKSSFTSSRHWGPRDPITHYYWLERRRHEEAHDGSTPHSVYHRRQLGQMSGTPHFLNNPDSSDFIKDEFKFTIDKKRANSDDLLYTVYRRQYLDKAFQDILDESMRHRRSKSFDSAIVSKTNCKISLEETM